MKPHSLRAALMAPALCCACTSADSAQAPPQSPSTIWQALPAAMLMRGYFGPAVVTAGDMRQHGSIGVGTPQSGDGELTMLDGRIYLTSGISGTPTPDTVTSDTATADTAVQAPDSLGVVFAIATGWEDGDSRRLGVPPGMVYEAPFMEAVDRQLRTTSAFYALRMTGTWREVRVRNLVRQTGSYRPFRCAPADTTIFVNVTGTMVGFREPPYADSLGVANYHLHFISDGNPQGGHVLSFVAGAVPGAVTLNVSERQDFTLRMPSTTTPAHPIVPCPSAAAAPAPSP